MQKKSEKNGESHFYSNRIYTGSNIRKKNTCRQVDLAKWSSEMGSITDKTILYSQIWREDTDESFMLFLMRSQYLLTMWR